MLALSQEMLLSPPPPLPQPGSYWADSNMPRVGVQRGQLCQPLMEATSPCLFCPGRKPSSHPHFLALHLPLVILKWALMPQPRLCWFWAPPGSWILSVFLLGAQPTGCAREMLPQISASWGGTAIAGGRNRQGGGQSPRSPRSAACFCRPQNSETTSSGVLSKYPPHLSETS